MSGASAIDALRLHDPNATPVLMGILNITPDSFSDGGKFCATDVAIRHALHMVEEGASIIDVGGESTRPGAAYVSADEQLRRILPVIEALHAALPAAVAVSVDTRLPQVAQQAIWAGASMINDISAGAEEGMFAVAAASGSPIVLMHMQGDPQTMQVTPRYEDVVGEVLDYLLCRAHAAESAGVPAGNVLIDPGIGFGKTLSHNLALLRALPRLVATGYPVLLGTSRKRFLRTICNEAAEAALLGANCATTALGATAGAKIFRVHDIQSNRQALQTGWAIRGPRPPEPSASDGDVIF